MSSKVFYTARDIASDLSISEGEAAGLVKELCRRIKVAGVYVIPGYVPVQYYEKQKAGGFLDTGPYDIRRVPLNEKRLLSIEEFCQYAGGIGERTARKYIREIAVAVRIGGRVLVDREKFDQWCDEHGTAEP